MNALFDDLKEFFKCHLVFSVIFLCLLVGTQLATVGRVSCEVPPASIPVDSRVCLGLVGRPLLDISLHYCQRHAAVCAGRLRPVETLDKRQDQVYTDTNTHTVTQRAFLLQELNNL